MSVTSVYHQTLCSIVTNIENEDHKEENEDLHKNFFLYLMLCSNTDNSAP